MRVTLRRVILSIVCCLRFELHTTALNIDEFTWSDTKQPLHGQQIDRARNILKGELLLQDSGNGALLTDGKDVTMVILDGAKSRCTDAAT